LRTAAIVRERVEEIFKESIEAKRESLPCVPEKAADAAAAIVDAIRGGGKVLVCGNGGSAADAQHMAGEMVVRYAKARKPFPAVALTTDTSVLTAQANDERFDSVFARQVEALGKPGDVLVAISTSGDSPDVIEAAKAARAMKMKVVGLTGAGGDSLARLSDVPIMVPSRSTPRIQEVHITVIHALCELVEEELA
jgi:D-sedoheptulose 7-phosphate isomerase